MTRFTPVFALVFAAGCSSGGLSPNAPEIAHVWESKCGACHVPVDPGTRTRQHLDEAFYRHKTRVALSDDEWKEMVDFLASDSHVGPVSSR